MVRSGLSDFSDLYTYNYAVNEILDDQKTLSIQRQLGGYRSRLATITNDVP